MRAAFQLGARLGVALAVWASGVVAPVRTHARAQAESQAKPPCDCQELADAKARLEGQAKRLNDWPDLARYREANAKLATPAKDEQRVVFMGDSITDMWVLPRFGGFFPGKPYIGRGISGQTTPQMLVRFRQDVINLQPTVVVILAGTNDIAGNTGPISNEDIEANFASLAELARVHGIRVILSSILPIHNYTTESQELFSQRSPERIVALNRWLKDYCSANRLNYIDYFSPMIDDKGLLKRDLAQDGLHPNKAGYAIMAPLAEKAIESTSSK